nr:unnamed protein product [Callosobruchus analis]
MFDDEFRIRDIVARWSGSTHDKTIFNNTHLKQQFEAGHARNKLLVGDAGYHLLPYLLTRLQNVNSTAENMYNESLIRTRNVVERQYGVLKRRLRVSKIGMRLNTDAVLAVIITTAVLYNLAIQENEHVPEDWIENLETDEGEVIGRTSDGVGEHSSGQIVRELLINEYFSNL